MDFEIRPIARPIEPQTRGPNEREYVAEQTDRETDIEERCGAVAVVGHCSTRREQDAPRQVVYWRFVDYPYLRQVGYEAE